ncbi:hypothetical protein SAMN02799622_05450 [Methylobacterium sp. UNC378MF]|nr:hypothetical protein SAMN02799622_05450 [Methylobacterium sp. UNC378MF]
MQKAATLDRTHREGDDAPEARTQRIGAKIAVDPVDAPRIHATTRGGEGQHGGPAAMRHLACPMDQWAMRTGMRACSTICRVTPPSRNSRTRLWV